MSPKGQIARVCPCDVLLGGGALVDTDREAQGLEHWSALGPHPRGRLGILAFLLGRVQAWTVNRGPSTGLDATPGWGIAISWKVCLCRVLVAAGVGAWAG